MKERTLIAADGTVYDADSFASSPAATMLSSEGFVIVLKQEFGVEGYERLHELMEIRHAAPRAWAEGEGLEEEV